MKKRTPEEQELHQKELLAAEVLGTWRAYQRAYARAHAAGLRIEKSGAELICTLPDK